MKKNKNFTKYYNQKTQKNNIGATSTSTTLSTTVIGQIILQIPAGNACNLVLVKKVLHQIIINKNKKYEKQYQKDQQTIKPFGKLYTKSVQGSLFDKNEFESLRIFFTGYVDETKYEYFLKI